MIEVTLLGPPRVERAGRPVAFDTRKAVALLAYLALADRPRSRDGLADLLWPEQDTEHARGALRRTLSTLRAAIGGEWVEATRDHVRLIAGQGLGVDVQRFRALIGSGDLEAAAALYRGEFLEGFSVGGRTGFDDWQRAESDGLRSELATVLGKLASTREATGDLSGALAMARRWLALDELHEPAHRALIRLSALTGDRASALTLYRECVRTLSRELGVPPLRETTMLYEAISQGTLDAPAGPVRVAQPEPASAPFVGRHEAVRSLLGAHRDCAEHGRVVLIDGEAGIGKTRLAEEFLTRARGGGALTLVGRAFEEESALAYAPVIEALRGRLHEGAGWVERVPVRALHEAARLLPELYERSDLADRPPRSPSGLPAAASLDGPGAATNFLAGVWETLVIAATGAGPGVLMIDDAQWADEASLQLLSYGLRRLTDRRLLVLLTWRSPHDHRLRRVVAELERAGRATVLSLARFDAGEVGELLRAARPDVRDPGLRQRLLAETEGLPFLLVEYLRVLGTGTDGDSAWTLPSGARDLLQSRLDPVSETGRQILAAAAVIGRSFDVGTVRATSGRAEDETVAALEELTRRGLIRERNLDYDFSHEQLRALVYSGTSLARRRLLHGRAAQTPLAPATLARHLRLAGQDESAALAYVRAAEQARSVFANAEAVGHLRAALALGHPDPGELYAAVGELQTLQGDYAAALSSYETAAATVTRDRLGGIEHRLGQVHHRRGEWSLAEAHLQAAWDAAPESSQAERARISADLSLAAHSAGGPVRAAELARRAEELAQRAGDQRALAQAQNLLGLLASTSGDPVAALPHLRNSLALAEQVGDLGARVAALNNLALAHRACGDLDEAVALTRDALTQCAVQGDRHREAALHNNLADLLHATDAPDEAMEHLKLAVTLFAEVGADQDPQPEIWKLVRW